MRGKNEESYSVYKHTSPSGKVYIGITKQDPYQRWNNGNGYKKNEHFYSAICKYGWENFNHEILFSNLTEEEACSREQELIAEFRSNEREYGYNKSIGGEKGALGVVRSEETKKKMSEAKKGTKQSEETVKERMESRFNREHNNGYRSRIEDVVNRLDELEDWARQGATNEIIAKKLGITRQTLWKYTNDNVDIFNAIKRGREDLTIELRSALIKKAIGYEYEEREYYTDDNGKKRMKKVVKYSHPDVAAINLALKNYDRDNWANDPQMLELRKQEVELRKKQIESNLW